MAPRLHADPTVNDLGCARVCSSRRWAGACPARMLHGYDVEPAMIEHARGLKYSGARPTLEVRDVAKEPLPLWARSVDLVAMTAVLHVRDDGFRVLAEVRRVLAPDSVFPMYD